MQLCKHGNGVVANCLFVMVAPIACRESPPLVGGMFSRYTNTGYKDANVGNTN